MGVNNIVNSSTNRNNSSLTDPINQVSYYCSNTLNTKVQDTTLSLIHNPLTSPPTLKTKASAQKVTSENDFLKEAEQSICEYERKIKQDFSNLYFSKKSQIESYFSKKGQTDSLVETEKLAYSLIDDPKQKFRQIDNFITFAMTPVAHAYIYRNIQSFDQSTNSFTSYLSLVNISIDAIALIYQINLFKEFKNILKILKKGFCVDEKLTNQQQEELFKKLKLENLDQLKEFQEIIKNLDNTTSKYEKQLKEKKWKTVIAFSRYGIKQIKNLISKLETVKSLEYLFYIKTAFSLVGDSLGLLVSGLVWKKSLDNKKKFNQHDQAYLNWNKSQKTKFNIAQKNKYSRENKGVNQSTSEKSDQLTSVETTQSDKLMFEDQNESTTSELDSLLQKEMCLEEGMSLEEKVTKDLICKFKFKNNFSEIHKFLLKKYYISISPDFTKESFLKKFEDDKFYKQQIVDQIVKFNKKNSLNNNKDTVDIQFDYQQLKAKRELNDQYRMHLVRENSESWKKFKFWMQEQKAKGSGKVEGEDDEVEKYLKDYIDQQQTIEITTKNALKQMVCNKYQLEKEFIDFKFINSSILFSLSVASFTFTLISTILGILLIPAGGIGIILLGLSAASLPLSLACYISAYIVAKNRKPNVHKNIFDLSLTKKIIYNLLETIYKYKKQNSYIKTLKTARFVKEMNEKFKANKDSKNQLEYDKAIKEFKKSKKIYAENKAKVKKWKEKIKKITDKLDKREWHDFVNNANLLQKDKQKLRNDNEWNDFLRQVIELSKDEQKLAEYIASLPEQPNDNEWNHFFQKVGELSKEIQELVKQEQIKDIKSSSNLKNMIEKNRNQRTEYKERIIKTQLRYKNYDDLQVICEMLEKLDLNLINSETQELLKYYMGVNLKNLQIKLNNKFDSNTVKEIIRKFFILNNSEIVSFLKKQQKSYESKTVSL